MAAATQQTTGDLMSYYALGATTEPTDREKQIARQISRLRAEWPVDRDKFSVTGALSIIAETRKTHANYRKELVVLRENATHWLTDWFAGLFGGSQADQFDRMLRSLDKKEAKLEAQYQFVLTARSKGFGVVRMPDLREVVLGVYNEMSSQLGAIAHLQDARMWFMKAGDWLWNFIADAVDAIISIIKTTAKVMADIAKGFAEMPRAVADITKWLVVGTLGAGALYLYSKQNSSEPPR